MQEQRLIGELLVRHGVASPEQLEPLYAVQRQKGGDLVELLVSQQGVSEERIAAALAQECGLELVTSLDAETVPIEVATKLPIGFARSHRLLAMAETPEWVEVIGADPFDTSGIDDVRVAFDKPVLFRLGTSELVDNAINRVYERQATLSELGNEQDVAEEEETDILASDDDAPVIRWVNSLFTQSVKERASDIHIEPEEREVIVRYRVDGQLYVARRASRQFMSSVVARVKIMAGLNIAEKRLPQDGRISLKIAGRDIDVRVSTVPTSRDHERVVMRLLRKTSILKGLSELGFSSRDYSLMSAAVQRPNGIVLVTGPTGSGKTTTLYACLNKINKPNINILTAEDPVEYELAGIHQVHVQSKIGLTFANAMRAFLRQDPDVIMVGEIRDKETAEIAMHASMTGHLVLSTIHTNDAASAFTRLVQMDIEPFRVRSTLLASLAQRLVRVLCDRCKAPYEATPYELEQLGIDPERSQKRAERVLHNAYKPHDTEYSPPGWFGPGMPTIYRPVGCELCAYKGYTGRLGIYELLVADDAVGQLVLNNADSHTIKKAAIANGMDTLRDDGARKVLLGVTSVQEVVAATQEDVFD